ncbi:membrane magnesium transporter-domain-containing protein [Kalaharituber pfeilii]|nr:membrane magnesium transporter-domain-containing protein [Kalaharituber pfeilii]
MSTKSVPFSTKCYSVHEHSTIAAAASSTTSPSLPLDIILETIISVSLLCTGIVLSGWELRPIRWRIWAGQLERENGSGPYEFLESKLSFIDIRAKRTEFSNWVRDHEARKTT